MISLVLLMCWFRSISKLPKALFVVLQLRKRFSDVRHCTMLSFPCRRGLFQPWRPCFRKKSDRGYIYVNALHAKVAYPEVEN